MLLVLIALTLGRRNEFIDSEKAKVLITVHPIIDMKTHLNSTLEMLERAYRVQEVTQQWRQNPKYSDYWPLFSTQYKSTIVKYVMEELRPF